MKKYQQKIQSLGGYQIRGIQTEVEASEYIDNVEKIIGFKLPKDYIDFLINYGRFGFPDVTYRLLEVDEEDNERLLSVSFGMFPNDSYDLIHNYYTFRSKIPANFLPIACDIFGNLVCISVNGKDKESVYFWQHDSEETIDEEPKTGYPEEISLIAKSFDEFIYALNKYENDTLM